ncbi:MAG: SPOR domain-containing protein [Candidatus Krumholzibacteriota bacterium]|nr:SPOR domain-containing protein [Candidatus Krumholzibacteriota bacterium]
MKGERAMNRTGRIIIFVFLSSVYLFNLSCAGKQTPRTDDSVDEKVGKDFADNKEAVITKEGQEQRRDENIYDIEEEMPENRVLKEVEGIEEKIIPSEADSFYVEDITDNNTIRESYTIGYRVQVFASENPARAKDIKRQIENEISSKVYIEFEDEMYKVRVGNYNFRKEAEEARKILNSHFPDCWITETTIRKFD